LPDGCDAGFLDSGNQGGKMHAPTVALAELFPNEKGKSANLRVNFADCN
jgi:hypothetical protein